MDAGIQKKFSGLIDEGTTILANVERYEGKIQFWLSEANTVHAQDWLSRSAFFLKNIMPSKSHYRQELDGFFNDKHYVQGTSLPSHTLQKVLGLLNAVSKEYDDGTLKDYEYVIFASAFDDFLDHAEKFHKGNMKIEASILSSIVFEDALKKIVKKNGLDPKGKSIEELIDGLVEVDVLKSTTAKRLKSYGGTRNDALHADWDAVDIREVGIQIAGIKSLIEEYL